MEQNISKVQERARADADLDDAWCGDEQDYDYMRMSHSSTPEFIDVESNDRPPTSTFTPTMQRGIGGNITLSTGMPTTNISDSTIPQQPTSDVKRGRGRPRKQRDTVEGGKFFKLTSQHKHTCVLRVALREKFDLIFSYLV